MEAINTIDGSIPGQMPLQWLRVSGPYRALTPLRCPASRGESAVRSKPSSRPSASHPSPGQLGDDVDGTAHRIEPPRRHQPDGQSRVVDPAGDVPGGGDEQADRQAVRQPNRDQVPTLGLENRADTGEDQRERPQELDDHQLDPIPILHPTPPQMLGPTPAAGHSPPHMTRCTTHDRAPTRRERRSATG
jgi:hypothetical protein